MKSNNFLDTDQESQLYMESLDSNDSYRPFPIVSQQRVVAGDLSQGQIGDMRLQQGTYLVSSASVQSGISAVCPDVKYVPPNTVTQQQYSTAHVQHTQHAPPGMLWGTHNITQGNLTQNNNTYSVPPPSITFQQEPIMLGEMYNVLHQIKLESDRLVDSTRKHTTCLPDVSYDYNMNQDHRSDRSSVQSWRSMIPRSRYDNQSESSHSPDRYRGNRHCQPTIHNRRRRRPATTQRHRDHHDMYYTPTDESDE